MNSKDIWIQKAKALFFDCTMCVDSDGIRKEIEELLEKAGGYDYRTESANTLLKWPTKQVMCPAPGCWERRVHHERPDDMRGPQYIEVPRDWTADAGIAFCSQTCSMMSGLRSAAKDNKKGWERFCDHFSDNSAHFHSECGDLMLEMRPFKGSQDWLHEYRPAEIDSDKVREGMCWDLLTQVRVKHGRFA